MKKIFFLAITILFFSSLKAQNSKVIYVELGGPGLLGSVNYDMRLTAKENGIGFRVGIGGMFFPILMESSFIVPVELNYLIGNNGKNYLELGAGMGFLSLTASGNGNKNELNTSFVFASIGYRYAPTPGGLFFKIAFNPMIGNEFIPYGGLGLGYKF